MTAFAASRDDASAAWFDGLADGRLLIRRCRLCGHHGRPDALACSDCGSPDLLWHVAEGGGAVMSVIVDHTADEHAVLGLVELDEGPWLHVRLVAPGPIAAGSRGRFSVFRPDTGEPIPVFVVDSSASTSAEGSCPPAAH